MRIIVFGANGPTGRLLCRQALAQDHDVVAVTRRPDAFGFGHPALTVTGADVHDAEAVAQAVKGGDAVLSTLGVPFGRAPVDVYSVGATHLLAAMRRYDVRRLACVTSSVMEPAPERLGGVLFRRVVQPYVVNRLGRTLYDDMHRLEDIVTAADVDWTLVRPSGLYTAGRVTGYRVAAGHYAARFTAREDLADFLLRQATETTWVRRAAAVATVDGNPGIARLIWREGIRKSA
jgi:uncharacterized protein YbjT (DUF2867 family)